MTGQARFVTALLGALDTAGIASVVLRNHEGLPEVIGNDLDLLVHPSDREVAERCLVDAAREIGWRLVNRAQHVPTGLYFCCADPGPGLQIDLFDRLWWRGFEILPAARLLESSRRVGPHSVPDPSVENALVLLSGLLYSGTVRQKYRPSIESLAHHDSFEREVAIGCGRSLAADLMTLLRLGQWDAVEGMAGRVRRTVVVRSLASPLQTVRRLAGESVRLGRRWRRPPGLIVQLLGTDGSGKSTVSRNLSERLDWLFSVSKSRSIHWRPTVRAPAEGTGPPESDPHGREARSEIWSAAFLTYHWIHFISGSWLGLQPVLFRNGLVICDRYYHDFFVDRRRYRLRVSDRLLKMLNRGFRQPDLTLILDVDPAIAIRRKQEVSPGELARQRQGYRQLSRHLSAATIIDASQPQDDVVESAYRTILEYLEKRARDRDERG